MPASSTSKPLYTPRPPPGIRRKLWEWSTKFECTFALSMMQPWEKAVIWSTLTIITLLFWFSVYTYLPGHLAYLSRRYAYYVYGDEAAHLDYFVPRVGEWVGSQVGRSIGEVRKGMGLAAGGKVEL
ncbi:hypothetical protein I352_01948 [Cryptococcus deuterogattii MMRL2647]|nr:hypothetical protein I352_01948 [Cryptococcus deuterogattii MMRL2647]